MTTPSSAKLQRLLDTFPDVVEELLDAVSAENMPEEVVVWYKGVSIFLRNRAFAELRFSSYHSLEYNVLRGTLFFLSRFTANGHD